MDIAAFILVLLIAVGLGAALGHALGRRLFWAAMGLAAALPLGMWLLFENAQAQGGFLPGLLEMLLLLFGVIPFCLGMAGGALRARLRAQVTPD